MTRLIHSAFHACAIHSAYIIAIAGAFGGIGLLITAEKAARNLGHFFGAH